ncbi:MAG: cbb3-type cytochrome c oxidase subunit 3 [Bradyrhizobiaceae bacterium]|nr:cbb3-type cytochrome c oxidase subunit 3 [Bradyrhizobiaceae bacterium]
MSIDSIIHAPLWDLLVTGWTPLFVAFFVAVLIYALRPRNRAMFDAAANMPLQED